MWEEVQDPVGLPAGVSLGVLRQTLGSHSSEGRTLLAKHSFRAGEVILRDTLFTGCDGRVSNSDREAAFDSAVASKTLIELVLRNKLKFKHLCTRVAFDENSASAEWAWSVLEMNSYQTSTGQMVLFPLLCLLNHACPHSWEANTTFTQDFGDPTCIQIVQDQMRVSLVALRDITEGEPLRVPYASIYAYETFTGQKQFALHRFVCACSTCSSDPSTWDENVQSSRLISYSPTGCAGCLCESESRLRCGRCKCTYYCSASCQRDHWDVHKGRCLQRERQDHASSTESILSDFRVNVFDPWPQIHPSDIDAVGAYIKNTLRHIDGSVNPGVVPRLTSDHVLAMAARKCAVDMFLYRSDKETLSAQILAELCTVLLPVVISDINLLQRIGPWTLEYYLQLRRMLDFLAVGVVSCDGESAEQTCSTLLPYLQDSSAAYVLHRYAAERGEWDYVRELGSLLSRAAMQKGGKMGVGSNGGLLPETAAKVRDALEVFLAHTFQEHSSKQKIVRRVQAENKERGPLEQLD